jgi:hypothetical protein
MSDEPKTPQKRWLSRTIAALVVIASYETVHYSTVETTWALGSDHACRKYDQHVLRYKEAPLWVERLFKPHSAGRVVAGK